MKRRLMVLVSLGIAVLLASCTLQEQESATAPGTTNPSTSVDPSTASSLLPQSGELCSQVNLEGALVDEWIREPVNPAALPSESVKARLRQQSSDSCIIQGSTNGFPYEVSVYKLPDASVADNFVTELSNSYRAQGKGTFTDVPGGFQARVPAQGPYFADTIIYDKADLLVMIFSPSDSDGFNSIYAAVFKSLP